MSETGSETRTVHRHIISLQLGAHHVNGARRTHSTVDALSRLPHRNFDVAPVIVALQGSMCNELPRQIATVYAADGLWWYYFC